MENFFVLHGTLIRAGIFISLFIILALWETWKPDHFPFLPRRERWASNIILVLLNNALLRFLFPVTALMFSDLVWSNGWGLLPNFQLPLSITIFLGILFLDLVIYLQHIMFHSIPVLWKLHRMHHADLELDVTSGTRFHPIEILISMGIKLGAIFLIGMPPSGVLLFEIILNAMAMFNHSNIFIPPAIDKYLRILFVTPSMHRVHHSINSIEYNTNFGFNLSIWDHLMLTYKEKTHEKLTIGLKTFRDKKFSKLNWMLAIPFVEEVRE